MKGFFHVKAQFFLVKSSDKGFWRVLEDAKRKSVSIGAEPPCVCLMLSILHLISMFHLQNFFIILFALIRNEQARNALISYIWKRAYYLLR